MNTSTSEIPMMIQALAFPKFDWFWGHVDSFEKDGCWRWMGSKNVNGYGMLQGWYKNCGDGLAHRLAYRFAKGDIPKGLVVCHRCDTPDCVNPDHLFLGTLNDNNQDKIAKGRSNRGMRHGMSRLSDDDVRRVRGMVSEGFSDGVIADRFGVNTEAIRRIRLRTGWSHIEGEIPLDEEYRDSRRSFLKRMTPELSKEAKKMRSEGRTYREIASSLGVSHHTIWLAVNRIRPMDGN